MDDLPVTEPVEGVSLVWASWPSVNCLKKIKMKKRVGVLLQNCNRFLLQLEILEQMFECVFTFERFLVVFIGDISCAVSCF